jgi:ribosomal protein S8
MYNLKNTIRLFNLSISRRLGSGVFICSKITLNFIQLLLHLGYINRYIILAFDAKLFTVKVYFKYDIDQNPVFRQIYFFSSLTVNPRTFLKINMNETLVGIIAQSNCISVTPSLVNKIRNLRIIARIL